MKKLKKEIEIQRQNKKPRNHLLLNDKLVFEPSALASELGPCKRRNIKGGLTSNLKGLIFNNDFRLVEHGIP